VTLGWLPATGWVRLTDDPLQNLRTAIMPALALAVGEMAVYTRLLRADMITTLQQDSITMARAKGMPTSRILFRHALRPSSFSLMTVVGLQVGAIIGGSVVIEELFALPGVGRLLVSSISQRDLIMVQGVTLVIAVSFVVINFVVDMLYTLLDPRIRHGRAADA
jgi:peptide/nickel transport system permease protein